VHIEEDFVLTVKKEVWISCWVMHEKMISVLLVDLMTYDAVVVDVVATSFDVAAVGCFERGFHFETGRADSERGWMP